MSGTGRSREYDLLTAPDISARLSRHSVLVPPIGSTEQHGPHLSLDNTDTAIAGRFSQRLVARYGDHHDLWTLPALPYGLRLVHQRAISAALGRDVRGARAFGAVGDLGSAPSRRHGPLVRSQGRLCESGGFPVLTTGPAHAVEDSRECRLTGRHRPRGPGTGGRLGRPCGPGVVHAARHAEPETGPRARRGLALQASISHLRSHSRVPCSQPCTVRGVLGEALRGRRWTFGIRRRTSSTRHGPWWSCAT
ncbi:creatininase family protein [Streptomyces sp. NPDC005760]|uniref:creatininase family protein n=1 Tax=Streptomyces sp. NPDC005760 TaxID=3156718 RepID=UPI0033E2ACAF